MTRRGSRWWYGLPAHTLPGTVYRAESARLRAAIDLQREAVNAAKSSTPPAEPKPAEPKPAEPKPAEPKPAEPIGEGNGHMRELVQVVGNVWYNVVATPFYALRCAFEWHSWTHVRRLSFSDRSAMPTRWHSYDVCAHCRRINLASETWEPWRPGDEEAD